MDEYNLTETQCLYERYTVKATKKLSVWRDVLSGAVAWLYCCQSYRSPDTGEIIFFGESLESFLAAEMYRYLAKTVDRMARLNIGKNAGRAYRGKYRIGIACRLHERIIKLGTAASWAPEREHRRLAAKRIFEGEVDVVKGKPLTIGTGSDAFKLGELDGEGISLNRQTGGHGGRYIEQKKPEGGN